MLFRSPGSWMVSRIIKRAGPFRFLRSAREYRYIRATARMPWGVWVSDMAFSTSSLTSRSLSMPRSMEAWAGSPANFSVAYAWWILSFGRKSYDREDYTLDTGFLIGNEARGLTSKTKAMADHLIRIPMAGQVESLNAAIASSILMFEAARQRREKS